MKSYINESGVRRKAHEEGKKVTPKYLAHLDKLIGNIVSIHIKAAPAKLLRADNAESMEMILVLVREQEAEAKRVEAENVETRDVEEDYEG